MKTADEHDFALSSPVFQKEHDELFDALCALPPDELQKSYQCSDRVFLPVLEEMRRQKEGIFPPASPALLCYDGIAFQYMAPDVFTDRQWDYVTKHLRILSALYGVLSPLDAVIPYRLEMQQKIPFSLYEFWSDSLSHALDDEVIVNLASKEYSKAISKWQKVIDVRFFEEDGSGKRKEKGVYAKMARGAMVRWMAENEIEDASRLCEFSELNYQFDPEASSEYCFVFVRKEIHHGQ